MFSYTPEFRPNLTTFIKATITWSNEEIKTPNEMQMEATSHIYLTMVVDHTCQSLHVCTTQKHSQIGKESSFLLLQMFSNPYIHQPMVMYDHYMIILFCLNGYIHY